MKRLTIKWLCTNRLQVLPNKLVASSKAKIPLFLFQSSFQLSIQAIQEISNQLFLVHLLQKTNIFFFLLKEHGTYFLI